MNSNSRCLKLYIGTYTSSRSKGIYSLNLDGENGKLDKLTLQAELSNPSYLTTDASNRFLYSVIETETFKDVYGGAVAAFSIDSQTGVLGLINYQSTKGKSPCHLHIDSGSNYLYAANYSEGTFSMFPVNKDGGIQQAISIIEHCGSGPNSNRQEKPHVHFVALTPEEGHLCAVDLGIDKVMVYNLVQGSKGLTPAEYSSIDISAGSGPRHIRFHPNGRFAYVVNELSSDIAVLRYHSGDCKFDVLQYISCLPQDYKGDSYCAALRISPDGDYIYASNRGHDSIACFKIDKYSGKLELVSHTSTFGSYPRDFIISPDGKFLFAANQNSDNIVTYQIMKDSGCLKQINEPITVPSPVCLRIINIG